jgi:hypothetical protein
VPPGNVVQSTRFARGSTRALAAHLSRTLTMAVPLTTDTERCVSRLFAESERAEAARLLQDECANNLPFLEKADAAGLERFRFAALKVSGGDLRKLEEAVAVAQQDWRDLLVAAGFANRLDAHRQWFSTEVDG